MENRKTRRTDSQKKIRSKDWEKEKEKPKTRKGSERKGRENKKKKLEIIKIERAKITYKGGETLVAVFFFNYCG